VLRPIFYIFIIKIIANMKRHLFRFLSAILTLLLMRSEATAQNGVFDVRFQLKDLQCADRNVTVELQVKAHSDRTSFLMGDANYRFEYDPRNIQNPRIVSQPNFSSQAPVPNANYGIQNLNGSKINSSGTGAIVSVNTFYTGSEEGGQPVPNVWTTVAALQFDLVNTDSCFHLKWHDDTTFPVTGMSEVVNIRRQPFDYNLLLTKAGGVFENLSVCPAVQCGCVDRLAPQFAYVDTIVVSLAGFIVSDSSHLLTSVAKDTACNKVKINYLTPLVTDDCGTPSVVLVDSAGLKSGSAFGAGSYKIVYRAKDGSGKTADCQLFIKVLPVSLLAEGSERQQACRGSFIALSARTYPNATYSWTGPQGFKMNRQSGTVQNVSAANAGRYTVTMMIGGCNYTTSVDVTILDLPGLRNDYDTISFLKPLQRNVLANDTLIAGARRTVRLVSQPNAGVLLMQSNGMISYTPSPSFTGTVTYSYEVCYEECAGLCKIGFGFITVKDPRRTAANGVPNVVTPNGDGLNDYLVIDDLDLNRNQTELVIYNQWGDLVFKAAPYKNDWGGQFKSQPLPDGTYYYLFTREPGGQPTAGFVTIFR
jgi:gliding motility-associated-like protein